MEIIMKKNLFKEKHRFSLRKYAIGTCSVLLGTSLFFVGPRGGSVDADEHLPKLVSTHYVEEKSLPDILKVELQKFQENQIEIEAGKDYYFVYRSTSTSLPRTGNSSRNLVPALGMGILLVSLTLVKKKKGKAFFVVTVMALGSCLASISALEHLVELKPAQVKSVEEKFLPSPDKLEGYEFTGYYFVREKSEKASEKVSTSISPLAPISSVTPGSISDPSPKALNEGGTSLPLEGVSSLVEAKPELESSKESVSYPTVQQEDPTSPAGQTKILQVGVAGERTILTEVKIVDGKQERKMVSDTVTTAPVTEIIAVGTKVESTSIPQEGVSSLIEARPELEVSRQPVPYPTVEQADPSLPAGQTRIVQAGVTGERTILTEVTTIEDRQERTIVSDTVTTAPVTEIKATDTAVESTSIPQAGEPSPVEVKPELEISQESVPYVTVEQADSSLMANQTNVVQAGVDGQRTILTEVTSLEGREERTVVSDTVTTAPVTEIIAVGTKVESTNTPQEGETSPVSVKPELETSQTAVAYTTSRQEDSTLPKGQTKVIQAGVDGQRTVLTEVKTVEGREERTVISDTVTTAPVTEIIAVGTKVEEASLPQPKVETKSIPYGTIYEADNTLEVGSRKTKIQGVIGKEETTFTYSRDQASGNITESSAKKTLVGKVDEVILVGTKPSVETKIIPNKTVYQADPSLNFGKQEIALDGKSGSEQIRTNYQLNTQTGQVTAGEKQKEVTSPVDKVVKIGNVEKIVTPIPIVEERRKDPSLEKNIERVEATGEAGESTLMRTYAVNPQTGELTAPVEKTLETKAMKPRVVLIGVKDDKPHQLPPNIELENAVDVSQASRAMKSMDLLGNDTLTASLQPTYLARDLITKKIELKKTKPNITDEEVKEALRKEYLERLSIRETLEETKQNLDADLKKVAAHTLRVLGDSPENRAKVKQDLEENKEKIFLGLTYVKRFYNIDFGDTNIRDILAYNPSSFGKKDVTSLDWLKHLGSMTYDEMKLTNSPKTFEKYFGKITDKRNLLDFLDYNRTTFTNMDGDTWLKTATKAIVVEKKSNIGLYTKLTSEPAHYGAEAQQVANRRQYNMATLLGLVNIKEPSIYAITNIATVTYGNIGTYMDLTLAKNNEAKYKTELERVKALVELTANRQADYVDTLYRISKENNRSKLITNRLIVDTMKKHSDNKSATIKTTWSKEFGPDADQGVKNFMSPLGMYSPAQTVGAEANGAGVRYFMDRVLDDRGSATYSHEMTHLLDRTVLFNNYGRRDGTGAEFYARGIFENSYYPETDTYFNLNFVFDESKKDSFYNRKPERFQSAADLKNYMHGSFDVLYSLDYLEAEATKNLATSDKMLYFKQLLPTATSGSRSPVNYTNSAVKPNHKSEETKALTETEASKLTDIFSLIDHHIVVNRFLIKGFTGIGKVDANGYYTVDMFDTIYGVSENDSGMSGDISFRKQAFELLAALGYYEGFVPYVSNQYKGQAEAENKPLSDKYIFEQILAGKSYAQFKKEQVSERIANLSKLRPISINYNGRTHVIENAEKLRELMDQAVKEELDQIKAGHTTAQKFNFIETPVQKLKKAVYKAYLKESDDFRNSIYSQ